MALPEYEQLQARDDVPPALSANLDVVSESSASPEVQQLYRRFRAEFDRSQLPGILQCFATHPPLLDHMMGLAKEMLFVDGALGRKNKEMISAFVSASNGCAYCADSHAYSFRVQGGTRETMEAMLACDAESPAISSEQRALLQFAEQVNADSHAMLPEDIDRVRAAGWTDLQIAETIHVAALFAAFNRVVNAFGLPSQNLLRTLEHEVNHG